MKNSKDFFKETIQVLKNAGIPSPELDARLIFEFVLNIRTEDFYKNNLELGQSQINNINKLIARRSKNEPLAYLTGHKEFFGLDFYVNQNVLIPRPESEWLVENSIKYLEDRIRHTQIQTTKYQILDVGTGSGCLIISIAKQFNNKTIDQCKYYASDISDKALNVALKNAKNHQTDINFIQSDLFKNIERELKFDLIIANLPYVPFESKLNTDYRLPTSYEPQNAIFARDNGTEIIKRFLLEVKDRLNNGGTILIELDPRNASEIKKFAKNIFNNTELEKDLAGFNRYLILTF